MSAPHPGAVAGGSPAERWAPVLTVLRHLAGWAVGSVLAGFAWLIVMQEGVSRGWTDVDYVTAMGTLAGATDPDITRNGWYVTMALWAVLSAVLLVAGRLVPGPWWRTALFAAIVPFLLWGFLFMGLVDAREPELAAGLFGLDDGWVPIVLAAAASVLTCITLFRVSALLSGLEWWRPKQHSLEASLAALQTPSLELPEERPEDRREGAGA